MRKAEITVEEIKKYWGSVEAYNEEQRRCGAVELEEAIIAVDFAHENQAAAPVFDSPLEHHEKHHFHLPLFGHGHSH
jgi:hypothetical protein